MNKIIIINNYKLININYNKKNNNKKNNYNKIYI